MGLEKMCENVVADRRKIHNEKLHDLYISLNIIGGIEEK